MMVPLMEAYRLAKTDLRLLIVSQLNQGGSATRNKGISLARGAYIGFVDSDDYIESTMYEKIYTHVKTNDSDIVVSNIFDEDSGS